MSKESVVSYIADHRATFSDLSQKVWEHPEPGLKEVYSSKLEADFLEQNGFRIKWYETPCAFVAEYGSGRPILATLGEYDALPGLSQKVQATKEYIVDKGYGHGCGHNLLGVGSLAAAMALKQAIESGEVRGTIRYYGCPAEETAGGKVMMDQEHAFDDLDGCLVWHPEYRNFLRKEPGLAVNSVHFHFTGQTTHAAAHPDHGRNALYAVELMNIGVAFLREKLTGYTRIHYVITHGGLQPNVTPGEADVWYYIRDIELADVHRVTETIQRIAKGAAMMTDTEVSWVIDSNMKSILYNDALSQVLHKNMRAQYSYDYTPGDLELGAALQKTLENPIERDVVFDDQVPDYDNDYGFIFGSNDVGEVSHSAPTATMYAATWPFGTSSHTWQASACAGHEIGRHGMFFAARSMAATLYDMFTDPALLKRAMEEYVKNESLRRPVPPRG